MDNETGCCHEEMYLKHISSFITTDESPSAESQSKEYATVISYGQSENHKLSEKNLKLRYTLRRIQEVLDQNRK